ncbi:uncharacterized protein LOC141618311 [Silene latifolia]|uniref:uncharacterized protein LOC141618311 n=1 Tax=Silene latifolia TaxID=37657 RepID=UPI003D76BDE6
MSDVLPGLINRTQSAFVKGRDIVENILIYQDLVKLYNRKSCSPRVLMKIDLQKAYDSIVWSFIKDMLLALEFLSSFIDRVMKCVCTPSYSIAFNGEVFGFFKGRRGIRQGDLMSPLLFTICMDYLSRLLKVVESLPGFKYHSLYELGQVKCVYEWFFSPSVKEEIVSLTGMTLARLRFKYLGVPIAAKNLAVLDCDVLVERVVARGGVHYSKAPLVSQERVCSPKMQGGLGILNSEHRNITTLGKYIWWIASKKDHLGVKWVDSVYIKHHEWWSYQPSSTASWA